MIWVVPNIGNQLKDLLVLLIDIRQQNFILVCETLYSAIWNTITVCLFSVICSIITVCMSYKGVTGDE